MRKEDYEALTEKEKEEYRELKRQQRQKCLDEMVWVKLSKPENFHVVRETLSRIGIPSKDGTRLYQSCHIFHKEKKYAIVHFKELFKLDGKYNDILPEDIARRNTIANLLDEWDLIELIDPDKTTEPTLPIKDLEIVPFKDKEKWELITKYDIGIRKWKN